MRLANADHCRPLPPVAFELDPPADEEVALRRKRSSRFPYVPQSIRPAREQLLLRGLQHPGAGAGAAPAVVAGSSMLVIGVSGGLDSTQALIVAARTMDQLGLPRKNVLAYTMPGFATSDKT
jgi:NAD+ synthase (glutamine-hydrolysing)